MAMPDARVQPPNELEAIVHTALGFAVRVQMSGGYTQRVRATTQHLALGLGAERAECSVSSTNIGVTAHLGGHSHTAFQHAAGFGVNFSELSDLAQLARSVDTMSLADVQARLAQLESRSRRYPAWLLLPMLGVSCASLSLLFGADAAGGLVAGVAGAAGATVREFANRARFAAFVATFAAALVSASVVVLVLERFTQTPDAVLAASVLYLVPGVPLLNGTADLLTGNYLNGVVRLTMGSVILLAAALGVTLALTLGRLL